MLEHRGRRGFRVLRERKGCRGLLGQRGLQERRGLRVRMGRMG